MGRPLRLQVANGLYHVTSRGARQLPLFTDDIDYSRITGILAKTVRRYDWECHSYCFMPNHLHLMIRTREANLSDGMQRLKHEYAIRFNLRHGFEGHAFDRRYFSTLIESEAHLLNCLRYIALNPVEAGLCESPSDWPHCSFRATSGAEPAPSFLEIDFVRGLFSGTPGIGGAAFAAFVLAGLTDVAA
jgi:putative transposase